MKPSRRKHWEPLNQEPPSSLSPPRSASIFYLLSSISTYLYYRSLLSVLTTYLSLLLNCLYYLSVLTAYLYYLSLLPVFPGCQLSCIFTIYLDSLSSLSIPTIYRYRPSSSSMFTAYVYSLCLLPNFTFYLYHLSLPSIFTDYPLSPLCLLSIFLDSTINYAPTQTLT